MEQTSVNQTAAPAAPAPARKPEIKMPTPKKKRRWPVMLAVVLVIAALVGWFVVKPILEGANQINDMLYSQAAADYRDITVSVSGTAAVQPANSYRATAMVQGEIVDAPFEEGDVVEAGALLFQFDTASVENSIRRSEISVEQQRLSYQNQLDNQKDAEKNRDVKAAEGGVVTKLYVKKGDTVSAGSKIADIVDRETMKLTVPFHSADAARIHAGDAAQVRVGSESFSGRVDSVAALDEGAAGGTLVRQVVILVKNPGAITPSSTATASVGEVDCASEGTFQYAASAAVTAKTSGTLEDLYVSEGDRVGKNQLIGRFEGSDMDSQIENARLSLLSAELSLQSSRDQLDNYTVTSPITGTVIEKNYKTGDNLEAGGGYLAVIYDMSKLTFTMKVDELYINRIKVGQEVRVTADALEGEEFTGVVSKININGTTMNGVTTYPVTVDIDDPQELLPGMNVSAEILVEHAEHVLTVPVEMVGRGNVVQVLPAGAVDRNGKPDYSKLEERTVTLGRNDEDYIEILSGLSEGETVVHKTEVTSLYEQMMGMGGMGGMGGG